MFLRYFDEGKGNLFILGDTDVAQSYRHLANAFGLDFYEQGARVYEGRKPSVQAVVHHNFTAITSSIISHIAFSGTGFHVRKNHRFAVPILIGSKTSKALNDLKDKEPMKPEGEDMILGAAIQGLNSARAVFLGSLDVCGNGVYTQANGRFCTETMKWAFQAKGLLRYGNITHYKIETETDAGKKPVGTLEGGYRVKDKAYYSIDIEEWKDGKWTAFTSPKVYVEFVMLDPYVRQYLSRKGKTFYTTFQLPDVYGVFQFKAKSDDPGFSWISTASEAPVRPFRHDEYERFLVVAYPYYLSVFSSVGSFLLFSFYFIYHKE